jgi:hypothetical protein
MKFLRIAAGSGADQHMADEVVHLLGRDLNDSNHPNFLEMRG